MTPARDLVVFPTLLELLAGGARRIRVGTLKPPTGQGREVSYRLIVEELPTEGRQPLNAVRLRVRMSLPVFVQPARPKAALAVASLEVKAGQARLVLENRGNAHLRTSSIQVIGAGAAGQPLLQQELKGWYLLAGGRRVYPVPLDAQVCPQLRTLRVVAESDAGKVEGSVPVLPSQCGP
jgi:fimbrial chaperone protein